MNNTKKAKWIGCLAAVAVFAIVGPATAEAGDHHRHHKDGNTAVQIVRTIVDLLDGPDVVVAAPPAPVITPPPAVVTYPAPVTHVVATRPAPAPKHHAKPAPAPKHNKPAPAPKHNKPGKGGRR